ncbi:DNA polymerase III subunit delta' [Chitinilyticum piscinae]|uniref:DNA polymerase III subunit delta n=1 Tax=Chitinilyticum piscinae TaxID=2866724 RepID=A0A8J7FZZ0_9NEIS|nr:DNA polymerase III subunit delta' [Chitinilyticum piscinae]MBE9609440.1 DNA polymerase III subunit delta' [Chitinilyticum piscinae]
MNALYPWQKKDWQALLRERERLPHALLLTGPAGIGKLRFAERLAQWLLCENPAGNEPCGECEGCRWFAAGNHPDYRLLSPAEAEEDEDGKTKNKQPVIKVDAIRELEDFVNLTSHRRGVRVTVVAPAETMNVAAANAFLKTLEEPPAGAVFILVAHHWRRLLPTIRSRCRQFPLSQPDRHLASSWLEEHKVVNPQLHLAHSGGAPLAALDDASAEWLPKRHELLEHLANPAALDVIAVAQGLEKSKLDVELVVDWLQKWGHDLVSLGLGGTIRYYPDWKDDLQRLSVRAVALLDWQKTLLSARKSAHHPLNARLVYETLLFAYLDALRNKRSESRA